MLRGSSLALCVLLLVTGCAGSDRREATSAGWKQHSERAQQLQHWTARGKLALRTSEASETAGLTWAQRGEYTEVHLAGPLGVGATPLNSDGSQLEIRRGDEHRILDISSPGAVALNTGWDLPLQALPYWLKGIPTPDYDIQEFTLDPETELLRTLRQDGWEILYQEYRQFQGLALPTRLQIQRQDTRARVLIRQWQDMSS